MCAQTMTGNSAQGPRALTKQRLSDLPQKEPLEGGWIAKRAHKRLCTVLSGYQLIQIERLPGHDSCQIHLHVTGSPPQQQEEDTD